MKIIILSYLLFCIAIYFLRSVMPLILTIGFVASWYMVCYGHKLGAGIILFVLMCVATVLYKVGKGEVLKEHKSGRKNYTKKDDAGSSNWILYAIPIFWPVIIVKVLLGDKNRPTDMTPYDYEQHLKSNAR